MKHKEEDLMGILDGGQVGFMAFVGIIMVLVMGLLMRWALVSLFPGLI